MKIMFLDESGNHDLNPAKINPIYPVFVLGGVIVDRAYLRTTIEPEMRQFKIRHFGRADVVLKPRFIAQSPQPADPYHVGLEMLIERFCQELGGEEDAGYICAEKRNPGLDRDLVAAWEDLKSR